jgi:GTP cyclohydrolase IA
MVLLPKELHMESNQKPARPPIHPVGKYTSESRSGLNAQGSADVSPTVRGAQVDVDKVAKGVRLILEGVGENPNREGLLDTPSRVARMYEELLAGHSIDPASAITREFYEDTNELILVRDIPFSSLCEHHMVPFSGLAHVGYIPQNGRITGLSKLARVVELTARRLQVQERMTTQIANALMEQLDPLGAVVVIEAEHLCMSIRGVRKPGSKTVTSALRGIFQTDRAARAEVMALINSKN